MRPVIVLDGPLGSELAARGVETPLPGWSAHALQTAPEVVAAIHRDFAAAGASVHTTNTFRTRRAVFGEQWQSLARDAVRVARASVPPQHRVAGSIAPLADCYRPDLSRADAEADETRAEHAALAQVLVDEGCDLLLCETFSHVGEAALALDAALGTGAETWVSWTPGPDAQLLRPAELGEAASAAIERGASAVLVNCVGMDLASPYVRELVRAADSREVLVGVYANAGCPDDATGWISDADVDAEAYVERAKEWVDLGAGIVGGCCGTDVAVVRALKRMLTTRRLGSS